MCSSNDEARRLARNAYMREWNARNKEKVRATQKASRAKKPEHYAAFAKGWYQDHREEVLARVKASYQPRPPRARSKKSEEERRQQVKAWHYANHEKRLAQKREWSAANRQLGAAYGAQRRAAKLQATPAWAIKFFINEVYDLARLRTQMTGIQWEVDHIVPLISDIVCGLHVEHNLRVVPRRLNRSKGNRHWPDMP